MSLRAEFPFDSPACWAARLFAASIQANALVELGFEEHLNDYEPRELRLIASQLPEPLRQRVEDFAAEKEVA